MSPGMTNLLYTTEK